MGKNMGVFCIFPFLAAGPCESWQFIDLNSENEENNGKLKLTWNLLFFFKKLNPTRFDGFPMAKQTFHGAKNGQSTY